jgi:hypothetical protein
MAVVCLQLNLGVSLLPSLFEEHMNTGSIANYLISFSEMALSLGWQQPRHAHTRPQQLDPTPQGMAVAPHSLCFWVT